jgi:hypothetical protein
MLSRAVLAFIAAARVLLIPGDAARLMQAELTWSDLWPRPGAMRGLGWSSNADRYRWELESRLVFERAGSGYREHSLTRTNFPRSCLRRREQGYRPADTISEKMLNGLLVDDDRTRHQPALLRRVDD